MKERRKKRKKEKEKEMNRWGEQCYERVLYKIKTSRLPQK